MFFMYAGDSCVGIHELTVFREYYAKLCDTMTDVDDLLKYFVSEKIIAKSEEEEIKSASTKLERVRKLLLNISGPLKAGDNKGFHIMLKIMKEHGTLTTQDLAEVIACNTIPSVNVPAKKVLEEQHES